MKNLFGRNGDILEVDLRAGAPQADEQFVSSLSSVVAGSTAPRAIHRRSRRAFASALAVFVLGAGASFGGVGYAASGASDAATAVKNAVKSSATDQYGEQPAVQPPADKGDVGGVVTSSQSGTLPFTGLSLLGTAALGFALVGAGIALRRRESRN
jgi:hypothetical protein